MRQCLWAIVLGFGWGSSRGLLASPPYPETTRVVEWLDGSLSVSDVDALRREALSRLPAPRSVFPADVELDPPRQVGRRTLISGRYTVDGSPVARSQFVLLFDGTGKCFAFFRPDFLGEDLLSYPGPSRLTSGDADAILQASVPAGHSWRLSPLSYWVEARRWACAACVKPHWTGELPTASPSEWHPEAILLDGISGEVFDRQTIATDLDVSGAVTGYSLPLEGPRVRKAYGAENNSLAMYGPLPFIPLELTRPASVRSGPRLTGRNGRFSFAEEGDGIWGLQTKFDTTDFTLTIAPGAQAVHAEASGVGDASVELQIELSLPVDILQPEAENRVGAIMAWVYLHLGLELAQLFQARNFDWPAGFGGKQEYVRGFPAFYNINLIRIPVQEADVPRLAGAYFDAFPPDRLIGISEANDIFHDWVVPALWHEFGHAVVSAFTGQINDPPPHQHNATTEEFFADMFALLMMEFLDPDGEIPCIVGQGLERGYPRSFQRNVKDGLVCYPPSYSFVPCRSRGGLGIYPPSTEPHEGSLVFSGFFYDLWVRFEARHGKIPGFLRLGDHLFRWLDLSRGDKVPPFTRPTILELITINDDFDFGGDDIPQNGSPDMDLIVEAAARRNLWLHTFSRGDANQDGGVDLSDAIAILGDLFLGAAEPRCLDSADVNDDGRVELTDAVSIVVFLFGAGDEPAPPRRCSGIDPTPDDRLTCESYAACK